MTVSLSEPEIEDALRLCAELPKGSEGEPISRRSLAEVETEAAGPRRRFLTFLSALGEPKLSELTALMFYGGDQHGAFETFPQALAHSEAMSLEAKTSAILEKTLTFEEYVRGGLARVG